MGTFHVAILHVRDDGDFGADECRDWDVTDEQGELAAAAWREVIAARRPGPAKARPTARRSRKLAVGGGL